jgi:hypothetical protein
MALVSMYPGKINSPETVLTRAVDEAATSLYLADATKLPAAPNICTLGLGEDAETVSYALDAVAGVLTVTRGVQGTARPWAVGTKVARRIAEMDIAAVQGNVTSINARLGAIEVAGGPGVPWQLPYYTVSGTVDLMPNAGYLTAGSGQTDLALPVTSVIGDAIHIVGTGTGGWNVRQRAGQRVVMHSVSTTIGPQGAVINMDPENAVKLVCIAENTTWKIVELFGVLEMI